jgi:hypothetical protein
MTNYEQAWDGEWWTLPRLIYLACCDCGLVHRVRLRVRKGKLQVQFCRDGRRTAAHRRKEHHEVCKNELRQR